MLKRKIDDLLYPDLSYMIVGCLYRVYKKLGAGFSERIYQKAVAEELKKIGLRFGEQVFVSLTINGKRIAKFYLDFVIEDKIALELKVGDMFRSKNIDQVYAYLKSLNLKLGIIANFTSGGVKTKRIVNLK